MAKLNKVIRVAHLREDLGMKFVKLQGKLQIVVFCDASFQNRENRASQGDYIAFITEWTNDYGIRRAIPIKWVSKAHTRVSTSTLGSELLSLRAGLSEAVYLKYIAIEIALLAENSVVLALADNKDLVAAVNTYKMASEKNLLGDLVAIRNDVANGFVKAQHIDAALNLASTEAKSISGGFS